MLSKAEMRKVAGGNSVICQPLQCFNEATQMCEWESNGNCAEDGGGDDRFTKIGSCKDKSPGAYCYYKIDGVGHDGNCASFFGGPLHCYGD